jgi:hypothetical protein
MHQAEDTRAIAKTAVPEDQALIRVEVIADQEARVEIVAQVVMVEIVAPVADMVETVVRVVAHQEEIALPELRVLATAVLYKPANPVRDKVVTDKALHAGRKTRIKKLTKTRSRIRSRKQWPNWAATPVAVLPKQNAVTTSARKWPAAEKALLTETVQNYR